MPPPITPKTDAEWSEVERRLEEGQLREQAERKLKQARQERLAAAARLEASRSHYPEQESPTASQRQGQLLVDLANKRAREADLQRVVDSYRKAEEDLASLRGPAVEAAPVQERPKSWMARARGGVDPKLVVAVIVALGGGTGISTMIQSCQSPPEVTKLQWEQHQDEWSKWKSFMRDYYRCDHAFTEVSGSAHRTGLPGAKVIRGVEQNGTDWTSGKLAAGNEQVWIAGKEVPECPVPPAD